jgi:hypothetical protein
MKYVSRFSGIHGGTLVTHIVLDEIARRDDVDKGVLDYLILRDGQILYWRGHDQNHGRVTNEYSSIDDISDEIIRCRVQTWRNMERKQKTLVWLESILFRMISYRRESQIQEILNPKECDDFQYFEAC